MASPPPDLVRQQLANIIEGRKTPLTDPALQELGYSIAGGTVRALARALGDYFASLKTHGTTTPFVDRMLDFNGINDLVGTAGMPDIGGRYE